MGRAALAFGLAAAVASVGACGDRAADPAQPTPRPSKTPAPPPANAASQVVVRGDTLDAIARAHYGSRHYAALLGRVNAVDAQALKPGAVLALPTLEEIAAPVARRVPAGAAAFLRAHAAWRARADALWEEHRTSRAIRKDAEVARAAADAKLAQAAFAGAGAPSTQLRALAEVLSGIAAAQIDPEGYALDDADRRFAMALAALLDWAR